MTGMERVRRECQEVKSEWKGEPALVIHSKHWGFAVGGMRSLGGF